MIFLLQSYRIAVKVSVTGQIGDAWSPGKNL